MKKLIILTTLLAYAVVVAWALQYQSVTVLDGSNAVVYTTNTLGIITNTSGTNNVILALTNATTKVGTSNKIQKAIMVNGPTVGLFVSFKLTGTGTAGPLFTPQKSYDGTNWETMTAFSNAANGTTLAAYWTNYTINDFGYVRLLEITNNSVRDITNMVVRWYNKQQ